MGHVGCDTRLYGFFALGSDIGLGLFWIDMPFKISSPDTCMKIMVVSHMYKECIF